jgi:XTP/dITP diphosphohydrolase
VTRFVLATANRDKAAEILQILRDAGAPVDLEPRPADVPDVEETGATLEANARLKAVGLAAATGLPAIADDTGLEVDALGGAPGVSSARFAGPGASYADNCNHLLQRLDGVPSERRTARFATVALAHWPDGREAAALGTVEGTIAEVARGAGGFGYDPVFVPDEGDGRTFAEMTAAEKHEISHRGRAFRTLADGLRVMIEVPDAREPEAGKKD